MKNRLLTAIALACGFAFTGAYAAEAVQDKTAPKASAPAPAERKATAEQRRAESAKAAKAGTLPTTNEASAGAAPAAPAGAKPTSAESKAAAEKRRAESAAAAKSGTLPVTNEAGTTTPAPKK
jgi:hypothetical protein